MAASIRMRKVLTCVISGFTSHRVCLAKIQYSGRCLFAGMTYEGDERVSQFKRGTGTGKAIPRSLRSSFDFVIETRVLDSESVAFAWKMREFIIIVLRLIIQADIGVTSRIPDSEVPDQKSKRLSFRRPRAAFGEWYRRRG